MGSDTKKKRSSVSKCFEDVVDVLQFILRQEMMKVPFTDHAVDFS